MIRCSVVHNSTDDESDGCGGRNSSLDDGSPTDQDFRICDAAHVDLGAKFQLKPGQRIESVQIPDSVVSALPSSGTAGAGADEHEAALFVFVVDSAALEAHRKRIVDAVASDRLTWVAYPKSGQLGTDLNRDSLAASLTASGVQPVRQVAVDNVWSALRFRPG